MENCSVMTDRRILKSLCQCLEVQVGVVYDAGSYYRYHPWAEGLWGSVGGWVEEKEKRGMGRVRKIHVIAAYNMENLF